MEENMVKKIIGKRIGAIALAAVLAATAFPADMSLKILADEQTQETNYFVDGDLGDDSTDDLWKNNVWNFDNTTWDAVDKIEYSKWASLEGDNSDGKQGIAFNFKADGTAKMFQSIESLKAGNYTITGYAKDTNSKGVTISAYMGSEDTSIYGSSQVTSNFNKFTFKFSIDEDVTNYKVGFQIDAKEGAWVCLDSVTLTESKSEEAEHAEAAEKLNGAISGCEELKEEYYSEASWKKLQAAIDTAKELSSDIESKTADEINEAADAILKAKKQLKQKSLHVEKIDNLSDDFIKGVDVSSYVSITESGAKFRDWDGNTIDENGFFELLKDAGVNYVRIRVWNNPYTDDKKGYGGGNCDLEKAKTIGKYATEAGMKVLIDFHYSDFWADPDRQTSPKAWTTMTVSEKETAVYEYTKNSLNELIEAGVDVGMVQVGNETNHGIAGVMESDEGGWEDICKIFSAGSKGVREAASDNSKNILVAVHFTDPQTPDNYKKISGTLDKYKVDYDVFASSYYPHMHGSLSNLTSVLKQVADTYDKKVMVAETSWAWTTEDGDGYSNSFDSTKTYDYSISQQGQANILRDVMKAVSDVGNNGIGMFYWEPAWIPANYAYCEDGTLNSELYEKNKTAWLENGCGWVSENAIAYDGNHVDATGGSVIDNQSLFDFEGNPLESLNVFKYVNTGCDAPYKVLDVVKTISVSVQTVEEAKNSLPSTIKATYNNGSTGDFDVTWDENALAGVTGFNVYTIPGTINYEDEYGNNKTAITSCTLSVVPDSYISNGDFENGSEAWTTSNADGVELKWNDTPIRGEGAMHFYSAQDLDFSIEQSVVIEKNGTYAACMQVQGGNGNDEDDIFVEITNVTTGETVKASTKLNGWCNWSNPNTESLNVSAGDTINIKVGVKAVAKAWGSIDDVFLYRTGDYVPDTTKDDDSKPDDTKKDDETVKPDDTKKDDSTEKTDDAKKDDSTVKTDDAKKDDSTVKTDDAKKDDSTVKTDETKKDDSTVKTDDTKKDDSAAKADDTKAVTTDTEKTDDKTAVQKQNDTTNTTEASKKRKEIVSENDSKIVLGDVNGILPASAKLSTEKVSDEKVINKVTSLVKDKINGVKDVVVYELDLTDGSTQLHQLDGKVQITMDMPFDISDNETIKVFRVDGDKLIPCASSIKDGRLVFETDHFSTYAFVKTADTQKKDVKAVSGGDNGMTVVWTFMIFAGVLIAFCSKKKKMN